MHSKYYTVWRAGDTLRPFPNMRGDEHVCDDEMCSDEQQRAD